MTNLLIALKNLAEDPIADIIAQYKSSNRANNMGDALEYYIRDIFCGSRNIYDENTKNEVYCKNFSYLGNQNNPPDIIIRNGDAIEVKKVESYNSGLALNSSYPKAKLFANSPMITSKCKKCENWSVKDIIYAVGVSQNKMLRVLWLVYGDCYAADQEIYERIKNKISNGITELEGVEFSETKELGRVNKVDPLGITYLRIRGMWHINNPIKVFNYITSVDKNMNFNVNAIMLKDKYLSFPEEDRNNIESLNGKLLIIKDVRIKSPNNPADLLDAKLIRMVF